MIIILTHFITETYLDIIDETNFNRFNSFTGIHAPRKHVIHGRRHVENDVLTRPIRNEEVMTKQFFFTASPLVTISSLELNPIKYDTVNHSNVVLVPPNLLSQALETVNQHPSAGSLMDRTTTVHHNFTYIHTIHFIFNIICLTTACRY